VLDITSEMATEMATEMASDIASDVASDMASDIAGDVTPSETYRDDVLAGLSRTPKTLSCRWLYDDVGCELFEEITRLDHAVLLEFGAGAGIKTEILIDALRCPRLYVPIDIAGAFLDQTVARFHERFPNLDTRPVVADFTAPFTLPDWVPVRSRVAFFPGSTIGNLDSHEAGVFLRRLRRHVGTPGRAIVGVDLVKNLGVLLDAYDDPEGVTAAFDLNLLRRANRELDADFALDQFEHEARWNQAEFAVEMHLVSLVEQTVTVSGQQFHFDAGETIHTESSRKYSVGGFTALANRNGWRVDHLWTDERGMFAIFGLS
jgi:dimethylhistidine N-methyltransferase